MISSKKENIAFSPYGLVSVALVLYEGSTGPSAAEIHNTLRLPWDREVTRVGFRDMHRYLKSYFSNDGFLRGLVLSKPNIGLRGNYTDLLQFYGFDVRTSPPKIPPVPADTTTKRPFTTVPFQTTTRVPITNTAIPERTTTQRTQETTFDIEARFGTTTTESPKKITSLPTTIGSSTKIQQSTASEFRTTEEKITTITTTKRRVQATSTTINQRSTSTSGQTTTTSIGQQTTQPGFQTTPITTKRMATTLPPTTITTTQKPTTTVATTQRTDNMQSGTTLDVVTMTDQRPNTPEIMSQVNASEITTKPSVMVDAQGRDTGPTTASTTQKPIAITKPSKGPESQTTLDVITMTDERPNGPEIMSQVNMSGITTTQVAMAGREGEMDMDFDNEKPITTFIPVDLTTVASTDRIQKPQTTTTQREQPTTFESTSTKEESIAETTVTKSVSIATPIPTMMEDVTATNSHTTVAKESETGAITLVIETTTAAVDTMSVETNTEPATESLIDQGTTTNELDGITDTKEGITTEASKQLNQLPNTLPLVGIVTEKISVEMPTAPPTTMKIAEDTDLPDVEGTNLPPPTLEQQSALEDVIDTAASEVGLGSLTRQQRSLYSTHKTPEQQQSGSNWVPQYYDQRWGRNPSNEFWFFTFTGGENVPAHTYTAYLPFAFVPELSSLVLQLPLDDPRYHILILLPEERLGLSQLLYALQWCPVRTITSHLKMTAVYAVVPAFTIVKHINLVPALAQMGIHSVFDPFRADLSPMTGEPHVFVRTIEQVVTVSLRKYYTSNRWFEASPSEVQQHFVANHPFAYFVLDKETGVTLMTGTIVNPVAHNQ